MDESVLLPASSFVSVVFVFVFITRGLHNILNLKIYEKFNL